MYLVISPKGGTGKTFISQNVIIPMLYSKYGHAVYVDFGSMLFSQTRHCILAINFHGGIS